jgi:hypothetical protein
MMSSFDWSERSARPHDERTKRSRIILAFASTFLPRRRDDSRRNVAGVAGDGDVSTERAWVHRESIGLSSPSGRI